METTVGNIATAIIAKLRNRTFHDFPSLETAVRRALREYNDQPFEKRTGSRTEVHKDEIQYLRPLPKLPYEIATVINGRKVYPNFHIQLNCF